MERLDYINEYLKQNKEQAYAISSKILNKEVDDASFNGIIGGKNATYSVNACDYSTDEEYVEAWLNNQKIIYEKEKDLPWDKSSKRIYELLQDEFLKEYISIYLGRTYYRKNQG